MSFDWNNYVILADELRALNCKGGVEARLRSPVSRGYYGVFHLVRRALRKEGLAFNPGVDLHQEVVQALRTSPTESRMKLGADLGRLRRLRNSADYDDTIDNLPQMEGLATGLCSSILKRANEFEARNSV